MNAASLVPLVVILPLIGAALALVFPKHPRVQRTITFVTLASVVVVGALLMWFSDTQGALVMEIGGGKHPLE